MITDNKKRKLAFLIFSFLCLIAVGVCLIVDFAVGGGFSWVMIVFGSVAFLWAAVTPLLLLKKHQVFGSLVATSVAALPLLYLIDSMNVWFLRLGLPIAATVIAAIWASFFALKYLKINQWYLAAIIYFIFGVGVSFFVEYNVAQFTGESLVTWGNMIEFLSSVAITALLAIVGYYSGMRPSAQKENPDDAPIVIPSEESENKGGPVA